MEHARTAPVTRAAATASLLVEALATLVAMFIAAMALDDITTDNSTGFRPEYTILALVGAWLVVFVVQLWRRGRAVLAGVSLLVLLAAAWVSVDGIGHMRDGGWSVFLREYAVITIAWVWCTAVAVALLTQAFRGRDRASGR